MDAEFYRRKLNRFRHIENSLARICITVSKMITVPFGVCAVDVGEDESTDGDASDAGWLDARHGAEHSAPGAAHGRLQQAGSGSRAPSCTACGRWQGHSRSGVRRGAWCGAVAGARLAM